MYGGGGGEGEEEQEREERRPPCQPKAHTNGASGWVGDSETEMTLAGESVVRGEER